VFVLAHLLAMAQALRGPDVFAGALARFTPLRAGIEAVLIGVPLLVHAGVGLALARSGRANLGAYPSNLAWYLQRASGVVVLLFLLVHVWETRVKLLLGQVSSADMATLFTGNLSSTGPLGFPWYASFYLVGVAATVYHLANGLPGFAASFGLVSSARAHARVGRWAASLGMLVFAASAATVIHLATGSAVPWGSR
jgi:succinate dehydrogenase / fumarate reductase cytochrome b subunit